MDFRKVSKQTLRSVGKLIFCRLIACPYLVIRARTIHTAVWRVIWLWFLIGWNFNCCRGKMVSVVSYTQINVQSKKKRLANSERRNTQTKHMKYETLTSNVIRCWGDRLLTERFEKIIGNYSTLFVAFCKVKKIDRGRLKLQPPPSLSHYI